MSSLRKIKPRKKPGRMTAEAADARVAAAERHHRAGRWAEAEKLYREVISGAPGHANALHLLGLLAHQNNRPDIAVDLISRAIAADGSRASFYNTLGTALLSGGRNEAAEGAFRRALALAPDAVEVHNNLGNALQTAGRFDAALACFSAALGRWPDNADLLNNLGYTFHLQGRFADAEAYYHRALAVAPADGLIHNNLGQALLAQGDAAGGLAACDQAIACNPNLATAYNNRANALMALGRASEAIAAYQSALALLSNFSGPNAVDIARNLGVALHRCGRLGDAAAVHTRALAFAPASAELHNALGCVREDMGDVDAAAESFAKAVALRPDYAEARNSLGTLRRDAGDFTAAMTAYAAAIAAQPQYTPPYYNRAELKTFTAADPELTVLQTLAGENLPPMQAMYVQFALGKALADIGDDESAFDWFAKANALKRATFTYDGPAMAAYIRGTAKVFPEVASPSGDAGHDLIFIVGMPRSGTTLLEQILASHPQVHGGGELTAFDRAARIVFSDRAPWFDYTAHADQFTPENLARLAETYRELAPLPPGKSVLVDKLPGNFLNIGLIRRTFPGSRIVHAVRDPVDTCVSCFTKLFREGHPFTYDLAELGEYHGAYTDLMAHWRAVLPADAILDVHYENVVANLDAEARRLVAYCGLAWDDRCLDFHATARPIATASAMQVRQPIYGSAVGRGGRYKAHLGPLRAALGREQG